MTPARPRPPGLDPGLPPDLEMHADLTLHPEFELHPDLWLDPAEPVVAPGPGPAFPVPRLPGTADEPDGIITCSVRPRRWRRRRRAVPAAVLAAVLAATVWAGVLVWHASPAAPRPSGHAQALHPHAVIHAAPGPLSPAAPRHAKPLHPHAVIHLARARQQARRQRTAQAAADTIPAAGGGGAAAGLHVRGHTGTSHPQPGPPRVPSPGPVTDGWTQVPGVGITNSSACMVELWTSQVSAGDPAYIAANAFQMGSLYPCQAMAETSTDGGQTWTAGTPVTLPASAPPATFSANTGAVYDGPGYLARACAQASNSTLACTPAVSLGSGTGTPADPAQPASTAVRGSGAGNASVMCDASLHSTTSAKGSGTLVAGEFSAGSSFSTTSSLCEGWLETSADQGATWQASQPVAFQAPAKSVIYDFTGPAADATGLLARACIEAPTVSATPYCTFAW
jgi:hypothetical protein